MATVEQATSALPTAAAEAPQTILASFTTQREVPLPPTDLLETDGVPLESDWYGREINLLCEVVECFLGDRDDFYVGGNMFLYFSEKQARNLDYRGPDFFLVNGGVSRRPLRPYWAIWNENARFPDVIIELLSPSTKKEDLTTKKDLYEKTFKTHEYYGYDPDTHQLVGWRLLNHKYEPIAPQLNGWLWCEELELWLGTWPGNAKGYDALWLRFFHPKGTMVLGYAEAEKQRADAEKQRAEAEKQRADALAAELAQLKAQLQNPLK